MAIIYRAQLTPGKLEALQDWLGSQSWFTGDVSAVESIGAYRLDDPEGEVGIEGHLLRSGTGVLHVPVTYRGAPLSGAEEHVVAVLEHSVLGRRWVYDAAYDPVAVATLTEIITSGGRGSDIELQGDPVKVFPTPVQVSGSGDASADPLTIFHVVEASQRTEGATLTGTWEGQTEPVVLARL